MPKGKKFMKDQNLKLPRGIHESLVTDIRAAIDKLPYYGEKGKIQAEEMLAKYCEYDQGEAMDRRTAAILKWLGCEHANRQTNDLFTILNEVARQGIGLTTKPQLVPPKMGWILEEARRMILRAIGDAPSFDIRYCRFSGGATTSRKRIDAHPASKYLGKVHVTRDALPIWERAVKGTALGRHYDAHDVEVICVPGNVLFTVPKSADIDRVCCKEPDLNIFLQKSFGRQLRWLLRRQGVNLDDQSRNQRLARQGSIDGSLATIDLSSASDRIARELVRFMLPVTWYHALDDVRSRSTEIPHLGFWEEWMPDASAEAESILTSCEVQLEMFSSMGNGFTFELESLIFWAISRATCAYGRISGSISIYGDDIIVPSPAYQDVVESLHFCGFKVNEAKSFHGDSPYRESCGAHWWGGADVKPFYIRRPTSTLMDLIHVLNSLILWDTRHDSLCVVDPVIQEVWERYAEYVPQHLWGGQDLNDPTALVSGHRPRKRLMPIIKGRYVPDDSQYVAWLHTAEMRDLPPGPVVSFGPNQVTNKFRVRANRQEVQELPLFLCLNDAEIALT